MSITLIFYPGVVLPVVVPISDGFNPVSTVAVSQWKISQRLSVSKATAWKVIAYGISKQTAFAFNTKQRRHVTGWLESNGLVRPVVWPIDTRNFVPSVAFDIDSRVSTLKKSSFKVIQRRSSKQRLLFDVYNYLFAHGQVAFNARQRVYKPGVTIGSWINQLDEPIIKPISYGNFTASPAYTWGAKYRVSVQKPMRFNSRGRLSKTLQVRFVDNGILVICQKAASWNVLERI